MKYSWVDESINIHTEMLFLAYCEAETGVIS